MRDKQNTESAFNIDLCLSNHLLNVICEEFELLKSNHKGHASKVRSGCFCFFPTGGTVSLFGLFSPCTVSSIYKAPAGKLFLFMFPLWSQWFPSLQSLFNHDLCVYSQTFCPGADTLSVPLNTNSSYPRFTHLPGYTNPTHKRRKQPKKQLDDAVWSVQILSPISRV